MKVSHDDRLVDFLRQEVTHGATLIDGIDRVHGGFGHANIKNTVIYTGLSPQRFKNFWVISCNLLCAVWSKTCRGG